MGAAVKLIHELKANWSERQMEMKAAGLTNKEAHRLHIECRKLNILDILKVEGGPFTSSEEIDSYLSDTTILNDAKAKRMSREVTYARDTSVSLPRSHTVFRIYNTSVNPRRLLTPQEFGDNLKILLGKRSGRTFITLQEYRKAVANISK